MACWCPCTHASAGALAAQNALSIQARITRGHNFVSLLKTNILNQDIVDGINDYKRAPMAKSFPSSSLHSLSYTSREFDLRTHHTPNGVTNPQSLW